MKRAFALLLTLFSMQVIAQQTVSTAGAEATGSGGHTSYTVGQVAYTSYTGSSGSVSEGVQQTFTVENSDGIDETLIDLTVEVFPNPASEVVIIQIEDFKDESLSFVLYDNAGKQIDQQLIYDQKTTIDCTNQPAGTYVLKITDNVGKSRTFKLIKQ